MALTNVITSIIMIASFLVVIRGFYPILAGNLSHFGFHVIRGVLGLLIVTILRTAYWDLGQLIFDDNWTEVRRMLGGQQFSSIFNLLFMIPAYDFLSARLHTIPKKDRHKWSWYTAWAHPGTNCLINWEKKDV